MEKATSLGISRIWKKTPRRLGRFDLIELIKGKTYPFLLGEVGVSSTVGAFITKYSSKGKIFTPTTVTSSACYA